MVYGTSAGSEEPVNASICRLAGPAARSALGRALALPPGESNLRFEPGAASPVLRRTETLMSNHPYNRSNLRRVQLSDVQAHGGDGLIRFARLADRESLVGGCNFIDLAELPPGTSIGPHTHARTEEEFYLVLQGRGEMTRNGETFLVESGDLIRNPPGGTHSLRNTGTEALRIFVFELEVRP